MTGDDLVRVAVVDDDYVVAGSHSAFVERTPGFSVAGTASDGAGARRVVRELQPDLVLLDVYMPDMTGLEVLQALRGVAGYLIKPFSAAELQRRLEHVAQVRRRLARLPTAPGAASGTIQRDVDRLFDRGLAAEPEEALPKGLSPETSALVQRVLREAGPDGVSAAECAERTGLSRVSARRYLEHFSRTGAAEVSARYGGAGRPERRFRAP